MCVSYLIDVLVSFDEVNREFPQWCAGRVSETGGDPPLEYGHIRQHLHSTGQQQFIHTTHIGMVLNRAGIRTLLTIFYIHKDKFS